MFAFILLAPFHQRAQNILANSDFTDINICTEHGAKCAPEAWFLASPNIPLYKNGNVGITILNTGKANVRQYFQTEMLLPMEQGETYEISLRIKADQCILNSIGIKFSDQFICFENDKLIEDSDIDFTPQLKKIRKRKHRKWMDLTFTYKATGSERFILIGSFQSDQNQTRDFRKDPSPFKNYHYFLDHIEIIPKHLDTLPTVCEKVREHLYSFDLRHSNCAYIPYEEPKKVIAGPAINPKETTKFDSLVLSDVLFDFNSSVLRPNAENEIMLKMRKIELDSLSQIKIYGYTDNIGKDEYNIQLSKDRAIAVKQLLIEMGLNSTIIIVKGLGNKNPISNNHREEGRAKNRRIEIVFEYY